MPDHDVSHEAQGSKGRYVIRNGNEEAELTYSVTSPVLVIADHTGVPDSFRGTGAGLALVEAMVADARAKGFRIMPLCPFVNAQRKKHPEWGMLFPSEPQPSEITLKTQGSVTSSGGVAQRPCATCQAASTLGT